MPRAFTHCVGQSWLLATNAQESRPLVVESELRTDKENEPVQVQPDQCCNDDGKACINLLRARRINEESRKYSSHRGPHESARNSTDKCRFQPDFGIWHVHIQEREHSGNQKVRHELTGQQENRPERFIIEQILHYGVVLNRSDHADRRYHDHWSDNQYDQILGKPTPKISWLGNIPNVVEALFNLLHGGDCRYTEKMRAQRHPIQSPGRC